MSLWSLVSAVVQQTQYLRRPDIPTKERREAWPQGVCAAEGPGGTPGARALSSLPSFWKDRFLGASISSWPNVPHPLLSQILYIFEFVSNLHFEKVVL